MRARVRKRLLWVCLALVLLWSLPVIFPRAKAQNEMVSIPVDRGVYESLSIVQIVTPTTAWPGQGTFKRRIAVKVTFFMDDAPSDNGGLALTQVQTTSTNITWRANIQNPSSGVHLFTFRVSWNVTWATLKEQMTPLESEDLSGAFLISGANVRYDFDDMLNWNVVSGTWSTSNGSATGFSKAEGLIYTEDAVWEDFTLDANVMIPADSPTAETALVFNFVDSENFYWAGLGCWGHRISISRMIAGVPEELTFQGDEEDVIKNVWYTLSVRVSSDEIELYVNNVLELFTNETTLTSGMVGIRVYNSRALVDYLVVSELRAPAPWIPPAPSITEGEAYRGFAVRGEEFIYEKFTSEHFRKIRQWGFNSIMVTIWWSELIEPYKDQPYVYDEDNLLALRRQVTLAQNEDLKVLLAGRVQYSSTASYDGWATHDYVNMQDEGLDRYARFWEMMVQRFPESIYIPWQCPYHKQGTDSARDSRFYGVTFPTLLGAIREHSNNTVVFVPIHQGLLGVEAGYYHDAEPLDDTNVIYGFGHMSPGKVEYDRNTWNYDMSQVDEVFEGIKIFRETYDAPMMSVEYFPLEWSGSIDQSRLDALEESLRRMKTYDAGWMYWRLSLSIGATNIIEDMENFIPQPDLMDLLQSGTV